MEYTQHFIIEGKHCGSAPRAMQVRMGQVQRPLSFLFVCPKCGKPWAQAPIEDCDWFVYTRPCQAHGEGSLWIPWEEEFIAAFPMPVLQREFERHLQLYFNESRLCP